MSDLLDLLSHDLVFRDLQSQNTIDVLIALADKEHIGNGELEDFLNHFAVKKLISKGSADDILYCVEQPDNQCQLYIEYNNDKALNKRQLLTKKDVIDNFSCLHEKTCNLSLNYGEKN